MALLDDAKAVCRVNSTAFDAEINMLIDAGKKDLAITDIDETIITAASSPLIVRALMTYVSMNFKLNNGQIEPQVYQKLKDSYDEQKSQLLMSSDYCE